MAEYRLTHVAQADIVAILAWSEEQFGEEARKRYEALIATASRDDMSIRNSLGISRSPHQAIRIRCRGTVVQ
jgi:toxin ParE1/3/4